MEDTLWLACGWLMEQTQGGGTGESKGNSVVVSLCSHQMKQGVFCCMRWAWFLLCIGHLSLAMSLMKKKAVEIWLYWVVGFLPISLIYLHLDVCFCSFGSEAVSVLCRLTGKWTALREVAISKQCVFVEVFFLYCSSEFTQVSCKRHSLPGRFLFPETSRVKPTSPDENTARLKVLGYSGRTSTINSKNEVDLKFLHSSLNQSCLAYSYRSWLQLIRSAANNGGRGLVEINFLTLWASWIQNSVAVLPKKSCAYLGN